MKKRPVARGGAMKKKIAVLSDIAGLANVSEKYDGYVALNGIYAFYGNTKRVCKKALKRKVEHCLKKMEQNGWEVINLG